MATSLIEELQLNASDGIFTVSNLLRKALVVAAKLDVTEIPEWINRELSGYRHGDTLPSYRTVHGAIKAKTLRGWITVMFPTNDLDESVSKKYVRKSIAEIEYLSKQNGSLAVEFAPEQQQFLQSLFRRETEFICFLDKKCMDGILDETRNQVLRWAIALDKAGIRGNGLSFTDPEKKKAHSMTFNVNSENFTLGVANGPGGHSNVAGGAGSRVNIQSTDQSTNSVIYNKSDMANLAEELGKLRAALLPRASNAEQYVAVGALASAEIAAREGKSFAIDKALSALGTAGKWAFDVATEIGVHLAAAALMQALGLPPG